MTTVIDAHHHFLDAATVDYPWLTPELEAIDRRFGPEDLAPELTEPFGGGAARAYALSVAVDRVG